MAENIHAQQAKLKAMQKKLLIKLRDENQMLYYRANPVAWLKDRFGEDAKTAQWDLWPGYEGHDWDGTPNPFLAAWQGLSEGYNVGIESATSTGKTYMLARIVYWFLDCFENPLVVTCAPKRDQLKLLLWSEISRSWENFRKTRPHALLNSLNLKKDLTHPSFFGSAEAVGFVAGVGANEESAVKAQGFHRENMLIIVEECPGVDAAIMKAFENTSTGSKNFILAVGNPDNQMDALHQFCETPGVKHIRISAYDHPNYVLNKEVIPGAVSRKSIAIRGEKYGVESQFYKSRIRGISPEEAEDGLFKMEWLRWAWDTEREVEDDNTYPALGVDVANSEAGDKAALAWGISNTLAGIHEFQCPNANHLALNVIWDNDELARQRKDNYHTMKVQDYNIFDFCIGVDSVGVGAATVNTFLDHGYTVAPLHGRQLDVAIQMDAEGKPIYAFNNRRSQMYWELREDLRQGKLAFRFGKVDLYKALCKELLVHTYTTKGGRIVVQSKDEVKKKMGNKSPNLADAVAYWNHVRRGHYAGPEYSRVYA